MGTLKVRSVVPKTTTRSKRRGLVHVYSGPGKGKTSAALGLALRASGAGLKVCFVHFLKGGALSSEDKNPIKKISHLRFDQTPPLFMPQDKLAKNHTALLKRSVKKSIREVRDILRKGLHDVVVLDEILNCLAAGFVDADAIIGLIRSRPPHVELVLTGRGATKEIEREADYVTRFMKIKHPFDKGCGARKGIEF